MMKQCIITAIFLPIYLFAQDTSSVYPKKLNQHIKGKKEITFLKKNKSPFYSIKTGKVSGYNDVGQVMFRTLISTKKKSNILKNFKNWIRVFISEN